MKRPTGACSSGRHDLCPGRGFDHDKRERIECTCECHETATDHEERDAT